jgi:hypothetical protein
MDSLTFANGVVQPVHDPRFVSTAGTDDASEPSDQQVSFATSAFDPYNSNFSAQVSSLGGDDEFGSTNVFSQAQTTLAYSNQDNALGTTLTTSDGSDTANLVLFGQYMASDFGFSSNGHGGPPMTDPLPRASTVANGTGPDSDGVNSAAAQAGALNINSSSATPVALSAMAEQAPPEVTAGLMWAHSMSDSAFAVATATAMSDPAAPSGGTAFAAITSTTSNSALSASGDGFVAVAGGLAATNGSTAESVATLGTGTVNGLTDLTINAALPSPNTWQQDVALMSNYLASTFPMPAVGDGFASSTALSSPPGQDSLAGQMLASHQKST